MERGAESAGRSDHPLFARFYARMSGRAEDRGQSQHRRETLAGLAGQVVEVGAGNGLNFGHYPETVRQVVAVEPEPFLRARAAAAAQQSKVNILVVEGRAEALPLADASQDAAVLSLVLCSVPEQAAALAEVRRVLRPRGELRFYEHVAAQGRVPGALQRAADRTFWPHIGGGCHLHRSTLEAIEAAGFDVERCDRFAFAPIPGVSLPHIRGVARSPAEPALSGSTSGRPVRP